MKRKIYEFIKANEPVSVNTVINSLNLNGVSVIKAIEELQQEYFVQQLSARPLGTHNDSSCYYKTTGKEYVEK